MNMDRRRCVITWPPVCGRGGHGHDAHAYASRPSGSGPDDNERRFTILGGHNGTFERGTIQVRGRSGCPSRLDSVVSASTRMNSHESAASDMEKRIELEKRGRAAEEVSGVQVRWAGRRGLVTLTESKFRNRK